MQRCLACRDAGRFHEASNPSAIFCGQLCQRIHHYVAIGGKSESRFIDDEKEEESATTLEDYSKLPPDVKRLLMEWAPSLDELHRWCQKDRESSALCRDPQFQIRWARAHRETLHNEIAKAFDREKNALLGQWLVPAIQASAWDPADMGNAAIRWAARRGHLEVVRFLASFLGRDFAAVGDEAIQLASIHGHLDVIRFLTDLLGTSPDDAIIGAAAHGHLEVVRFLARLPGVEVTINRTRALGWAAADGHLEVVRFLASLPGVYPAARDNRAIRDAGKNGHLEMVRFLLSLDRVRQTLSSDELEAYQRMI